ncbi:MAG: SDR family NAD(P)-dependent oxidoreductase [Bacteroidota bacterium]
MIKTALVTGATSGIGKATAFTLIENGFRVIVCGRRSERLKSFYADFGDKVYPLTFDVRDRQKVFNVISELPDEWKQIDVLINNAGNSHGLSSVQEGDVDDWDAMIDINVKGLLYVSKAVIPNMVERQSGHIINIGSIAGKEVYPNGNVYCASKHAVDAINNGMRLDLNQHGIKVSAINPGLVETEFSKVRFKGDEERAASVYHGFHPLTAQDIADIILFTVTRPYHVNLSDLIVLPTAQASATMVKKS